MIRLCFFLEFRRKHANDILAGLMHFSKGTLLTKEAHLVLFAPFLEKYFSAIFIISHSDALSKNFPPRFLFKFRSIFVRISSSIDLISLIRTSLQLEISLSRADFEYKG